MAGVQDREIQALLPAHSLSSRQPATGAALPAGRAAPRASPGQSRASAQQAILDEIKATLQVSSLRRTSAPIHTSLQSHGEIHRIDTMKVPSLRWRSPLKPAFCICWLPNLSTSIACGSGLTCLLGLPHLCQMPDCRRCRRVSQSQSSSCWRRQGQPWMPLPGSAQSPPSHYPAPHRAALAWEAWTRA